MERDDKVIVLGEGTNDGKCIFGTTLEAARRWPKRVIETPLSENMLTGALAGLAANGWKPIYVHARSEFSLLGMSHIVGTLAKWKWLHNGQGLPIVIRMLVGRGWGQGSNHSQAFHSMFAHVPGLKVLYPVDPRRVGTWLGNAFSWKQPVVIIEPRRMYDIENLSLAYDSRPCRAWILTFGDCIIEAQKAQQLLAYDGIHVNVFPIEDMNGLADYRVNEPVVIVDTAHIPFGASAEIAARLAEAGNTRVRRVGPPFMPQSSAASLEATWYPSAEDIVRAVCELLGREYRPMETAAAGRDGRKEPF